MGSSRVYRLNGSVFYVEHWSDSTSIVSWVGPRDGLSFRVSQQSDPLLRVGRRCGL